MRCLVIALAILMTAGLAGAQDETPSLDLPVSLERIREALANPDKPSLLGALDKQPNFRIEIEEKRPSFADMFSPGAFDAGPVPPGGLYAYEQQRMLFPNSTPALFSIDALPGIRQLIGAIGDCAARPLGGRRARRGRTCDGGVLRSSTKRGRRGCGLQGQVSRPPDLLTRSLSHPIVPEWRTSCTPDRLRIQQLIGAWRTFDVMRLFFLMFAATLLTAPAYAEGGQPSSPEQPSSSTEDARRTTLPVSLDRIREGLASTPPKSLLSSLERPPDFKVEIQEEHTIQDILSTLDFKTGPAPAGGLYGYEQQRMLFNPVDRPLAQPYAAFSPAEAITIAIQNLMFKYLGGKLVDAVTSAERARAEAAARREVTDAIATYCAANPERATRLSICTR